MKLVIGIIASFIALPVIAFVAIALINQFTLEKRTDQAGLACKAIRPAMSVEEIESLTIVSEAASYKVGDTIYYLFPDLLSASGPYCAVKIQDGKVADVATGHEYW